MSLKTATRVKRQAGQDPVYYRISNSTHTVYVPMRKLLSHSKTKKELSTIIVKIVGKLAFFTSSFSSSPRPWPNVDQTLMFVRVIVLL